LRSGCSMSSDREKVSCIDRMNRCPERNLQSCEDLSAPGTRPKARSITTTSAQTTSAQTDSLPDREVHALPPKPRINDSKNYFTPSDDSKFATASTGSRTPSARNTPAFK